jgi:hypothetical protein
MSTATIARPDVDVGGWWMDHSPTVTVGARFLAPSGRIWTVCAITPRGHRLIMMTPSVDGECGAVMDVYAVLRMVPLDPSARGAGWPADTAPRAPQLSSPGDLRTRRHAPDHSAKGCRQDPVADVETRDSDPGHLGRYL